MCCCPASPSHLFAICCNKALSSASHIVLYYLSEALKIVLNTRNVSIYLGTTVAVAVAVTLTSVLRSKGVVVAVSLKRAWAQLSTVNCQLSTVSAAQSSSSEGVVQRCRQRSGASYLHSGDRSQCAAPTPSVAFHLLHNASPGAAPVLPVLSFLSLSETQKIVLNIMNFSMCTKTAARPPPQQHAARPHELAIATFMRRTQLIYMPFEPL